MSNDNSDIRPAASVHIPTRKKGYYERHYSKIHGFKSDYKTRRCLKCERDFRSFNDLRICCQCKYNAKTSDENQKMRGYVDVHYA